MSSVVNAKRRSAPEFVNRAIGRLTSKKALPGRSVQVRPESLNEATLLTNIRKNYRNLPFDLPWELLDVLQGLSRFNPDFSQAVDNVRTLANSGHEVIVEGKNKRAAARLKDTIESKARLIQQRIGGIDGIINCLLDQAATFGCMTGEWILNEAGDDVIDFALMHPKNIRFTWDEDQQMWQGWQKVNPNVLKRNVLPASGVLDNYVKLNPITFFYYPFDPLDSPYGTPPFLGALLNTQIQSEMQDGMVQIIKKLGLLGMVDMAIEPLAPEADEQWEEYEVRMREYLETYASILQEMAANGGLVHFRDSEVKVTSATGNASGATNLFKQNEEQVFSGLKSMPSVQGRSYSTTETYAGVSYDIIIRNSVKYQAGAKRVIEGGYHLMALLAGDYDETLSISLKFNKNRELTRLQDANAEQKEIDNGIRLWAEGVIDQSQLSQRLGYDNPREPRTEPVTGIWYKKADPNSNNDGGRPPGTTGTGGDGNA